MFSPCSEQGFALPSGMDRQINPNRDVEAFLERMTARYSPTRRLQANEEALDAALNDYRRALGSFDKETLDAAWRLTVQRHNSWCWPKIPELVEICREAYRGTGREDTREHDAADLAQRYTRRFMRTTDTAAKARECGYEPQLQRYVEAVAQVQARLLPDPEAGCAYQHHVLFGKGPRDLEAEARWWEKQREQARTGTIRVVVPRGLVRMWSREAECGRER